MSRIDQFRPLADIKQGFIAVKFAPTAKEKARFWWALGAMSLLLAFAKWIDPPLPPFSGKWGWFNSVPYKAFGIYGPALTQAAVGLGMIACGVVIRQQSAN